MCRLPSGRQVLLPVIPGILKHSTPEGLPALLRDPDVAHKYTLEALRMAAWPILRQFPRDWLRECLGAACLKHSREAALTFLLTP